ncbi:hypothetical protein, partial [Acinetobacter baumannii]|uniref:hypothetical protein n=1 Tax=Acinetobacter baumannii TaxID=470 RepID=UPI001D17D245
MKRSTPWVMAPKRPADQPRSRLAISSPTPGQTEAEHHRAGQLRQGGVVQRRGGQAAEQQGRKQDEVVDALGAGPELLAGKGPQTQEITSNDQR